MCICICIWVIKIGNEFWLAKYFQKHLYCLFMAFSFMYKLAFTSEKPDSVSTGENPV